MADGRRILAVSVILSLFSALAAAFQCCGVLLSLLMIQGLRQRQLRAKLFWFKFLRALARLQM